MTNPNPSLNWYLDPDGALEAEPVFETIETDNTTTHTMRIPRSWFQAEDWQLLAPPKDTTDAKP